VKTDSSMFHWPHEAEAAVCLSYDDGMPCHVDLVAPMLEEFGFRGTFYTPINSDIIARPDAWRDVARRGHELGNHTIFHPCRRPIAEPPEAEARAWNNLSRFDAARFGNELKVSNFALRLLDGHTERTYGNTCHNVSIGPDDSAERIEPILAEFFVAGRG
jgi:peptidoglycan/xylan/chitin deacetylase (PgdA/CDA1 family)